jgi:hypothetical protein
MDTYKNFEPWLPCIRVEPSVQLEYRNPVLRREQYSDAEKCENPVSNQGPAAEKGVILDEKV